MPSHQCHICQRSYSRSTILRDHLRVHTGEKPFTCAKCPRSFVRAWDLKQHETIHDFTGSYKYRCAGETDGAKWGCGVGFPRKRDLHRHIQRTTGQRCRDLRRDNGKKNIEAAEVLASLKHSEPDQDDDSISGGLSILQPYLHNLFKTHGLFRRLVNTMYLALQASGADFCKEKAHSALLGSSYKSLRHELEVGITDSVAICLIVLIMVECLMEHTSSIGPHADALALWYSHRDQFPQANQDPAARRAANQCWQTLHTVRADIDGGRTKDAPFQAGDLAVVPILFRSTAEIDILSSLKMSVTKLREQIGPRLPTAGLALRRYPPNLTSSVNVNDDETGTHHLGIPVYSILSPVPPVRAFDPLAALVFPTSTPIEENQPTSGRPSAANALSTQLDDGLAQYTRAFLNVEKHRDYCRACHQVGRRALDFDVHSHAPFRCKQRNKMTSSCEYETFHFTVLFWHLDLCHDLTYNSTRDPELRSQFRNELSTYPMTREPHNSTLPSIDYALLTTEEFEESVRTERDLPRRLRCMKALYRLIQHGKYDAFRSSIDPKCARLLRKPIHKYLGQGPSPCLTTCIQILLLECTREWTNFGVNLRDFDVRAILDWLQRLVLAIVDTREDRECSRDEVEERARADGICACGRYFFV